ncbi:hypothetical protein HDR60_00630 [bacterium]|nr:hypothetical protein [bacterium]
MNKKISLCCLALCLTVSSVDVLAQRGRSSRRSGGTTATQKNVSSSIISGFGNKYFKNASITLVEKRSVNLSPLMVENNLKNITKTDDADASYKLCIPCANIVLEYEKDGKLQNYSGGGNCYSLEPGYTNLRLTVQAGAIKACSEKVRMTINDVRNPSTMPEVDSVVLNILPNSSAYDYSNLEFMQEKEILELVKDYDDAKKEAKDACNISSGTLKEIRNLLTASTAVSAVATATGATDTALQIGANVKEKDRGTNPNSRARGLDIASTAVSAVSTAGNLASTVTSFISVKKIDDLIDDMKKCTKAATKMHNAGLALEAGLEDITSADNIEKEGE